MLNLGRNFTLEDVHVEGTERIAEAVAKYDVDRYIHVSSHNANPNSSSEFFATKVCPRTWLDNDGANLRHPRDEESSLPEASFPRPPLYDRRPSSDSRTTCC